MQLQAVFMMVSKKGNPGNRLQLFAGEALKTTKTNWWAIALALVMLISLAVLFAPSFGNRPAGFTSVAAKGWQLDHSGTFSMNISNLVGQSINVQSISVVLNGQPAQIGGLPLEISPNGDSGLLSTSQSAFGAQSQGSPYAAQITVNFYDLNSNKSYSDTGTVSGKALQ